MQRVVVFNNRLSAWLERSSNRLGFKTFHTSVQNHEWVKTRLDDRKLLSLHGENSQKFLQGLITNNVSKIGTTHGGEATYTAFLTPPGRIQFDCFIYSDPEPQATSLLIDHHRSESDRLASWLRRFLLRSRVQIAQDSRELWAIWPSHSSDSQAQLQEFSILENSSRVWKDHRGDQRLGYRLLGDPSSEPKLKSLMAGLTEAPLPAYSLHVLLHASLPPSLSPPYGVTLPFEGNLDYHRGVDFRKGCYVGQELTARTYHTGVIRKRLITVSVGKDPQSMAATIPESFSLFDSRVEEDLAGLLESADLKLDAHSDLPSGNRKTKSIGKLCGPMISTEVQNGVKVTFGLALLRIGQDTFDPSSDLPWPSIHLNTQNDPSSWHMQPIKPTWWPSK